MWVSAGAVVVPHYSGRMPPAPVDPERLLALGTALEALRECARDGADEVLAHLVEVGDRETQSAIDAYLDLVADLLREIDASASEVFDQLRIAASRSGDHEGFAIHPATGHHGALR